MAIASLALGSLGVLGLIAMLVAAVLGAGHYAGFPLHPMAQ